MVSEQDKQAAAPNSLLPSDLDFLPCGQRVARLDALARHHLADSLAEALQACVGHLTWREDEVGNLINAIRYNTIRPEVMAIYIEFVDAIFLDDTAGAQILLDELLAARIHPGPGRQIRTIGGPQETWAIRYRRIIADDPDNEAVHLSFNAAELQPARERLTSALTLIADGVPELAAELHVLLRDIVLSHRRTPLGLEPDITGASSFYLWGAAFINFTELPARLSVAEALVHEAAHSLLFGMSLGAPLVLNDVEERYASPLRDDPRPMDGVVHAAYVLARLTFFLHKLLRADVLDVDEVQPAQAQLKRHRQGFADTMPVIRAHARFTPTGELAFGSAMAWMAKLGGADDINYGRRDLVAESLSQRNQPS